jgi:hypothetical protein
VISYRQHAGQLSKTALYKTVTARRLVFISQNKSEIELLALSENPDLALNFCAQISTKGDKKSQFKRLQRFENFERLRISRVESRGAIAKLFTLLMMSRYPNFIISELLLKTRGVAIGLTWRMKNQLMRKP